MLEVDPPHHPTRTWRDFFIHIATIVVGFNLRQEPEGRNRVIHDYNQAYSKLEDWLRDWLRVALPQSHQKLLCEFRHSATALHDG